MVQNNFNNNNNSCIPITAVPESGYIYLYLYIYLDCSHDVTMYV